MRVARELVHARDDGHKPTLAGTSTAIGASSHRVRTVALLATLTGAVAAIATFLLLSRPASHAGGAMAAATADPYASPTPSLAVLESAGVESEVPALEPGPQGNGSHVAARSGRPSTTASPSAKTAGPAFASPTSTPITTSTGTPTPTATTPDPSFDPGRGYVEVGLVNAQGVREPAVRAALHGVGLAACYRAALRALGARAPGVATLNLSIDENGTTRSAIVTGANFLPGLARCVQGAATGVSVPRSQVDSGGGTAEVTLAFKSP
jgi:hypothetical protein